MKSLRLDARGLTIVELMIALVLTAGVGLLIASFSVDQIRQSTLQSTKNTLLGNAQAGLDRMANDIRLANSADTNNRWQDSNAPSAPTNLLSWQSDSDTLVLAIAAQKSNGDVIFDDPHDYVSAKNNVVYYLSGGSLWRRTLAADNTGNAAVTTCPPAAATSSCPADGQVLSNIDSFSVQYFDSTNQATTPDNARSVQLFVRLKVNKFGQDIKTEYTTRMVFRNG